MLNLFLNLTVTLSLAFSAYAGFSQDAKSKKIEERKVIIKMWTSRNGGAVKENVLESVDIGGLYFDRLLAYDLQYESQREYQGLKLRDLISQYKPIPKEVDFVLLHSKRGMVIPVEISSLREDTKVFIALATRENDKANWSTTFPASVYAQPGQKNSASIPFDGNKMVVGDNWRHTDFSITPWRFFDTLAGIEFVSSHNHYSALEPKDKGSEVAGRSVYMRRCQYCHGVGEFGAKFGPNFLQVVPKDKKHAVELIMKKVLPQKDQRSKMLGVMPAQEDFKEKDAKDLASWINAVR